MCSERTLVGDYKSKNRQEWLRVFLNIQLVFNQLHTLLLNLVMLDEWSASILQHDPMRIYRAKRDSEHRPVTSKYNILGFISSGTYGRVYKAQSVEDEGKVHAIKKFKPDKEGDVVTYTGISQSAIREIAVSSLGSHHRPLFFFAYPSVQLNRELSHENIVSLKEVILEEKSIYMVFEYAEHDFLVRTFHLIRN